MKNIDFENFSRMFAEAVFVILIISILGWLVYIIQENLEEPKCDIVKRAEFMEKCMQTKVPLEDKIKLIMECRFTSKIYCNK
jgi:hypothetical protein